MADNLDRPALPTDLGMTIAWARVDPTLPRKPLLTALRGAIADRGGYVDFDMDERGWVVWLLAPEREEFRAQELEQALAWCLVWLMRDELGGGRIA